MKRFQRIKNTRKESIIYTQRSQKNKDFYLKRNLKLRKDLRQKVVFKQDKIQNQKH